MQEAKLRFASRFQAKFTNETDELVLALAVFTMLLLVCFCWGVKWSLWESTHCTINRIVCCKWLKYVFNNNCFSFHNGRWIVQAHLSIVVVFSGMPVARHANHVSLVQAAMQVRHGELIILYLRVFAISFTLISCNFRHGFPTLSRIKCMRWKSGILSAISCGLAFNSFLILQSVGSPQTRLFHVFVACL